MEQVAKLKRAWYLALVFQIVQKISEKYCPCSYLSIDQIWWVDELWFKRYIQKWTVSCTNTHHDVTDLLNHGIVKNTKKWIYWEPSLNFLQNKKIRNMCLKWHILRSSRFVAEVTFNCLTTIQNIRWQRKLRSLRVLYLIREMLLKVNYFATDKVKSLLNSIKSEMILFCVYAEFHIIYFEMIFYTFL